MFVLIWVTFPLWFQILVFFLKCFLTLPTNRSPIAPTIVSLTLISKSSSIISSFRKRRFSRPDPPRHGSSISSESSTAFESTVLNLSWHTCTCITSSNKWCRRSCISLIWIYKNYRSEFTNVLCLKLMFHLSTKLTLDLTQNINYKWKIMKRNSTFCWFKSGLQCMSPALLKLNRSQ